MFKIVNREEMAEGTIVLNDIIAPKITNKAKSGRFVIIRANETGDRLPRTHSRHRYTKSKTSLKGV